MKISKIISIATSKYLKIIKNVQNTENIYLFSIQIFKLNQFLCKFKYLVLQYSNFYVLYYFILIFSMFGFLLKNT